MGLEKPLLNNLNPSGKYSEAFESITWSCEERVFFEFLKTKSLVSELFYREHHWWMPTRFTAVNLFEGCITLESSLVKSLIWALGRQQTALWRGSSLQMGASSPLRMESSTATTLCHFFTVPVLVLHLLWGLGWSDCGGRVCVDVSSSLFAHSSSATPRALHLFGSGNRAGRQLLFQLHVVTCFHSFMSLKVLPCSWCRSDARLARAYLRKQSMAPFIYHLFRLSYASQSPQLFLKLGHQAGQSICPSTPPVCPHPLPQGAAPGPPHSPRAGWSAHGDCCHHH